MNSMFFRIARGLMCWFVLLAQDAYAEWFEQSTTAMTTRIELVFWHHDATSAKRIGKQVFNEFDRIEALMSSYRADSELSLVNRQAAKQQVVISPELYYVLNQAQKVSELSKGAFDITFASVGYLYDFRNALQPGSSGLNAELSQVDYRNVLLDEAHHSVGFRQPGVRIDLGGIAKGYAVDKGIEILKRAGIESARLSAGGDMRLLGDKLGQPWIVGVKDPRVEHQHAVVLPLSSVAMSTSGDYERFFIDASGNRVHHILSPKTGRPVKGIQSVTVIGPKTMTTDGLSTAVFVLGVQPGLSMINRLSGIDAIIIDSERKLHFSEGLMEPALSGHK